MSNNVAKNFKLPREYYISPEYKNLIYILNSLITLIIYNWKNINKIKLNNTRIKNAIILWIIILKNPFEVYKFCLNFLCYILLGFAR